MSRGVDPALLDPRSLALQARHARCVLALLAARPDRRFRGAQPRLQDFNRHS